MEIHQTDSTQTQKISPTKKIYHAPNLIEWGNLKDITQGTGGSLTDGDSTFQYDFGPQPL
jgi:hypothetical protein